MIFSSAWLFHCNFLFGPPPQKLGCFLKSWTLLSSFLQALSIDWPTLLLASPSFPTTGTTNYTRVDYRNSELIYQKLGSTTQIFLSHPSAREGDAAEEAESLKQWGNNRLNGSLLNAISVASTKESWKVEARGENIDKWVPSPHFFKLKTLKRDLGVAYKMQIPMHRALLFACFSLDLDISQYLPWLLARKPAK